MSSKFTLVHRKGTCPGNPPGLKRWQAQFSPDVRFNIYVEEDGRNIITTFVADEESLKLEVGRVTFTWLAVVVPRRVWQEETGDALEVIAAMEKAGCSAFKIKLKIWTTIFWVLLNGLRETIAALTGRKSPHK